MLQLDHIWAAMGEINLRGLGTTLGGSLESIISKLAAGKISIF